MCVHACLVLVWSMPVLCVRVNACTFGVRVCVCVCACVFVRLAD